jgi:hypothetical protein
MREVRNADKILVRKPEMIKPLEKLGRRWENNSKLDLREVGWDGVDWMHLAHDRDQWRDLVNTVMNFWVP